VTLREWLTSALTPTNIVALLCAVAVFLMGVERFQNKTAETAADNTRRIAALEARNVEQDLKLTKRRTFMLCSIRSIDAMNREVRAKLPCDLDATD
jgi:apolipoprotein N-acyltransferase